MNWRKIAVFRAFENITSFKNLYVSVMTPVCEKHGLTYMELTVLMFLHNNPNHDTASEIVKLRRLTKSHVSISVRSLIGKGLLTGDQNPKDRRTIHLHVTDRASAVIKDGTAAQRNFGQIMFAGFSQDDLDRMNDMISRITNNVNSYESNGGNYAG